MSRMFEELDRQSSPMGDISLRRRLEPSLQVDVWEVKLGEDFLMSSLFTTGERALATLGLAAAGDRPLDVVVGGLGLGYTTIEALADERVRSLVVIEALEPVIDWHRRALVPLGTEVVDDPRASVVHGDFFALAADGRWLEGRSPDAILLDIDHSPRHLLDPSHAALYTAEGLRSLSEGLRAEGVFAMWSNDSIDDDFLAVLRAAFTTAEAHVVSFPNFYQSRDATSTIYVAIA